MKRITGVLIVLVLALNLNAHPWKPRHYVIVDTDGGVDDIRALSMLLASPDVRVLAVTVSEGALNSGTAYIKVRSLLNSWHHEGLPVAINNTVKYKSPDFTVAMTSMWGDEKSVQASKAPGFIKVINDILTVESTKISFICLGGMSSAATAFSESEAFRRQVKEIIWSGGADFKTDFNYKIDPASAEKVIAGSIPVRITSEPGTGVFYNEVLTGDLESVNNRYARTMLKSLGGNNPQSHQFSTSAYDEMTVLLLHYPGLFLTDKNKLLFSIRNVDDARDSLLRIISGSTVEKNQVLRNFPFDPGSYFKDLEPSVNEIIEKYGEDEWISGVIANELHRHLGVFAIVGVKMGIRAREYFCTGVDEFSAFSYAGSTPPLSCMNDGIQVSTGATPGHGLLKVKENEPWSPAAEFTYLGKRIRVTLKPEYAEKISSELREIAFVNSLDSDIYWELVRKNSIKYWLSMDRWEIFIIEELAP